MAHLGEEEFGLAVIKVILIVAAVILTTADRTYAAHSGAECYLHGHRIYMFLTV
jgi:amino acid permease